MTILDPGARMVFQGDSITDCGRDYNDPESLGMGYPNFVGAFFYARYPNHGVKFFNRAVNGNVVHDLQLRWQKDTIDLKPTWVSILIGLNDTANRYRFGVPTPDAVFEASYRDILQRTRDINARIIMMEQFILPIDTEIEKWREDLDPKIQIVRKLAREFKAILIPTDGLFAAAAVKTGNPADWAKDGIHPTWGGQALIAEAWMHAIEM